MASKNTQFQSPLSSRPLDLIYFIFFLFHVPASLLVDFQTIYPAGFLPSILQQIPPMYIQMSNDPLIGSVMGFFGDDIAKNMTWFKSFLLLEAHGGSLFQFPVFFLGMRGLWKGSKSIYVLLLIYAASTTTTTLPCLAIILNTPITFPGTVSEGIISVSFEQKLLLLSSYIPFFLIPFVMTLDMATRVLKLVNANAGMGTEETKRKLK